MAMLSTEAFALPGSPVLIRAGSVVVDRRLIAAVSASSVSCIVFIDGSRLDLSPVCAESRLAALHACCYNRGRVKEPANDPAH